MVMRLGGVPKPRDWVPNDRIILKFDRRRPCMLRHPLMLDCQPDYQQRWISELISPNARNYYNTLTSHEISFVHNIQFGCPNLCNFRRVSTPWSVWNFKTIEQMKKGVKNTNEIPRDSSLNTFQDDFYHRKSSYCLLARWLRASNTTATWLMRVTENKKRAHLGNDIVNLPTSHLTDIKIRQ